MAIGRLNGIQTLITALTAMVLSRTADDGEGLARGAELGGTVKEQLLAHMSEQFADAKGVGPKLAYGEATKLIDSTLTSAISQLQQLAEVLLVEKASAHSLN